MLRGWLRAAGGPRGVGTVPRPAGAPLGEGRDAPPREGAPGGGGGRGERAGGEAAGNPGLGVRPRLAV